MELETNWPFGTEFAEELLDTITALAKSRAGSDSIKKLEYASFSAYWAGSVLRIDIPEKEVNWNAQRTP